MRYEKEVNEIMNKIQSVEYDVVGLIEKVKNDAITDERDRIRFAIVQYALDNNIDTTVIEPFIKLIEGRYNSHFIPAINQQIVADHK